jgi:ADP-heptose:LPS heptosyltransferase
LAKQTQHIAVMRLSAMGDIAMTVPVIRALVNQYPGVKITFVSRPFFRPFFEEINNVAFFDFDENKRHKGLPGLYRLYKDLMKLNVDAFADLHDVIRSKFVRKLFFFLTNKKVVHTDKGLEEKKALTSLEEEEKVFLPIKNMFERHADTFKKLGFSIHLANPIFPPKKQLSSFLYETIQETQGSINDKKIIGIAPFAQYESKVYPLDLIQKVIAQIAKNQKYKILLFGGGESETQILESLSTSNENVINVAGKVKFQEEIHIISNLDLMVSMDSGNAHIAAMLGIKTITLWGATHPYAGFLPFNQPLENALVSERSKYPLIPTSVYGNKIVEGYEDAMRTILPENVVKLIEERLN